MLGTMKRVRVKVRGIVQGVGFRPFVYRLAQDHGLTGWVRNTSSGVEIEIEGNDVDAFLTALQTEFPPMARIEEVTVSEIAPTGERGFTILESLHQEGNYQLVSPDIATCAECLKEVFAPKDRRFRYPFTNCTNCGPRFTIIEDIPYDRPLTTMRPFRMCPECQKEYDWPLDRRFHAQPNACPACGPRLSLTDAAGNLMPCEDSITAAAQFLSEGKIVAIKGLGGFLLACDATNAGAVRLLRERKVRPGKPFAVMVATLDEARTHCRISPAEAALLKSAQSPIVLLQWRADSTISPEVAPSLRYLGVMLPYTPLHHLLLREVIRPLVMTSGNLSEEPIATRNEEALRRLKPIADCFLLHNRDIHSGYDDSVCLVEQEKPRSIRR
ncbi:MAG: carbamoyltransferase HypF, partial [Chloroflexi bacterium]|nr:carbamoyltransferase HypF [Chloroflexota bacterium]